MEFTLENMYKDLIKFSYCSFDRIVIRGHVPILQGTNGGGIVHWARTLEPNVILTKPWLESFSTKFHVNVKKFAREHNIPIISVNLKDDKNEIAKEHLPKNKNFTGVYLIIKSREMTWSFTSQTSKRNLNPQHRNIDRQKRCVDHFYFYLIDKDWGPICFRFSSHLPFNVKVYLNGNRWLVRQSVKKQHPIKAKDNAIIDSANPSRLQELAYSLNSIEIRSVCDRWVYRLLPVLTYEERNKSSFQYQWFLHQIEYTHNMVFKSPWNLTKLFQRHITVNYENFHPKQIETFFGHRHHGNYQKDCNLRMYHQTEAVTVMRIQFYHCFLKQYNKLQRIFRSEVTINDVKDLKIRKSIDNFAILKDRLEDILSSFQKTQSAVHQATCTRGELTALAKPENVGLSRIPGIRLDNEHTMAIIALLPRLMQDPDGFCVSELRKMLFDITQRPYTSSQISYNLRKLRAKNLIIKLHNKRRYMLTKQGTSLAFVLPRLADYIFAPIINISLYPIRTHLPERFKTQLDQSYYKIENEVSHVIHTLGIQIN